MRILFADDDHKLQTIMRLWLEKDQHHVDTVDNGRIALEMLQENLFDCLITDVNMPMMNGMELSQETLKLEKQPNLIIILTSRCDIGHLRQQFDSPKVHFYNKPFSPAALAELIRKLDEQRIKS